MTSGTPNGSTRLLTRVRSHYRWLSPSIAFSMLLEFGGQVVFGPDPKFFPQLIESRPVLRFAGAVVTNIDLLVIATALAFDFTNGFHDTANAVATSIATGALTPRPAVMGENRR